MHLVAKPGRANEYVDEGDPNGFCRAEAKCSFNAYSWVSTGDIPQQNSAVDRQVAGHAITASIDTKAPAGGGSDLQDLAPFGGVVTPPGGMTEAHMPKPADQSGAAYALAAAWASCSCAAAADAAAK